MIFIYISPNNIPSRSAYSINIINQCYSLSKESKVYLITLSDSNNNYIKDKIYKIYGVRPGKNFIIIPIFSKFKFISYFKILINILKLYFIHKPISIISRNLYLSFVLLHIPLKINHIYEIHHPTYSFREMMQKKIIYTKSIKKIFITKALRKFYFQGSDKNSIVLPDAAEEYKNLFTRDITHIYKNKYSYLNSEKQNNIGYFGSLYHGRGIEKIIILSKKFPNINFYIIGGPTSFLNQYSIPKNLICLGYMNYSESRFLMLKMSILIIPYSNQIKINSNSISTAKWMSPLKIFEYMSSKKLIVTNDIKVLKEVLNPNNSVILKDNISEWENFIKCYIKDRSKYESLISSSYNDFKLYYSWNIRSKKIINFIKNN